MTRFVVEIDGSVVRVEVQRAVADFLGVAVSAVRVYAQPDEADIADLVECLAPLALGAGRAVDAVLTAAVLRSAQAVAAGHNEEGLSGQVTPLLELGLSALEIEALFREALK